jgi:acyl-CoA thioester hydrolase
MDALGHVNNTRHVAWFEQARVEYLEKLGGIPTAKEGTGPILAHISCDYLRAIVYPADVEVGCRTHEDRQL